MIYCMLAKFFSCLLGLAIIAFNPELSLYLHAFLIGILPIWSEVLASRITNIEPAQEKNKKWLWVDALIDAWVFLFVPSGWFFWVANENTPLRISALFIFVMSGLWRLYHFVKKGLSLDGYFRGLPVTYTGYLWLLLILLKNNNLQSLIEPFLFLISWGMVTPKIKIKVNSVS